jgi:hypothetical protein
VWLAQFLVDRTWDQHPREESFDDIDFAGRTPAASRSSRTFRAVSKAAAVSFSRSSVV